MTQTEIERVESAEVVIGCDDLPSALDFYVQRLGFRVDSIFPAEDPVEAVLRGYGLRLRLDPMATSTATLRLRCPDPAAFGGNSMVAPDGTVVQIVAADPPLQIPPIVRSFVLERASDSASWTVGRAGMRYRDLIPGRQGGRFVASHIHIPHAGLVPDYVHFHNVRFQMIYCYRGWVRLVYEDQGEPFIMTAGDCALQPPRIRHRVLECSANLEVIEIGCPALHETSADAEMSLPTSVVVPDRLFDGQRFVFHRGDGAEWIAGDDGFDRRRFGLREATFGLAEASLMRPSGWSDSAMQISPGDVEFLFRFVLDGSVTLERSDEAPQVLTAGDSFVIPDEMPYRLIEPSSDLQLLEVILPG